MVLYIPASYPTMIPLEKQVVNLELSKRLKKLGVRQESHFYWMKPEGSPLIGVSIYARQDGYVLTEASFPDTWEYVSAFTVAELGEMLPIEIEGGEKGRGISSDLLNIKKGNFSKGLQWQVMYYDVKFFNADTEADCRAKMLIYLVENKLV